MSTVEKVEGLTVVDADTIAVINDNDFQVANITIDNTTGTFTPDPNAEPIVLGLITTPSNPLNNSILGTQDDNSLYGTVGSDFIYGLDGNDQIFGSVAEITPLSLLSLVIGQSKIQFFYSIYYFYKNFGREF